MVWIFDHNNHRFYFSFFSLVLVLMQYVYQSLKTVFDHISKQLRICQKYSATHHVFNSLVYVQKCDQTWSLLFGMSFANGCTLRSNGLMLMSNSWANASNVFMKTF